MTVWERTGFEETVWEDADWEVAIEETFAKTEDYSENYQNFWAEVFGCLSNGWGGRPDYGFMTGNWFPYIFWFCSLVIQLFPKNGVKHQFKVYSKKQKRFGSWELIENAKSLFEEEFKWMPKSENVFFKNHLFFPWDSVWPILSLSCENYLSRTCTLFGKKCTALERD